jgi:hypothetical protein
MSIFRLMVRIIFNREIATSHHQQKMVNHLVNTPRIAAKPVVDDTQGATNLPPNTRLLKNLTHSRFLSGLFSLKVALG